MAAGILAALPDGVRRARRVFRGRRFGPRRYGGDAVSICRQIVRDNWNGVFFEASAGPVSGFRTGDLGLCAGALVRQGWREEVRRSLEWALEIFEAHGVVRAGIAGGAQPVDARGRGAEDLPLLLRAIRECEGFDVARRHRAFLGREIHRFRIEAVDETTGLGRRVGPFAGGSSFLTSVMIWLLASELRQFPDLPNPFAMADIGEGIVETYWRGDQFADEADGRGDLSGEANAWPFWVGLVSSLEMRAAAFRRLEERGLASPFPLRSRAPRPNGEGASRIEGRAAPASTDDTIRTRMGPIFIALERDVDPDRAALHGQRYRAWIEQLGNYMERFDGRGDPYVGRLGLDRTEEGMLGAALFLDLAAS